MIQNNCAMCKLSVRLVAMASKSLREHLKRCDWRERKRPYTGRENQNTSTLITKETKIYLTRGRNINLCVKFVIFTDIQRKEIRLFNKSNGVSFMYRWFKLAIDSLLLSPVEWSYLVHWVTTSDAERSRRSE